MKSHNELTYPDGAHTYSRGPAMLALAAEGYGLEISDQQMDDWVAMFGGIYKLDGVVDSPLPDRERKNRFDRLLDDVTLAIHDGKPVMNCGYDPSCQLCHLRNNLVGRGEFDLVDIGFRMEMLFDLAEKRRNTTKVQSLAYQCRDEGELTASLLYMPGQPGKQRKIMKFNMLVMNLGAAGTLLDTALDLEEDYDDGLCKVPPTKVNKMRILMGALPLFALTAAKMPKPLRLRIKESLREAVSEVS